MLDKILEYQKLDAQIKAIETELGETGRRFWGIKNDPQNGYEELADNIYMVKTNGITYLLTKHPNRKPKEYEDNVIGSLSKIKS